MEVTLPWMTILLITVGSFIFSSIWHGPIFGKLWQRIHHDSKKFTDEEMKKLMKDMWKLLIPEFIVTFVIVMTLAFLIKMLPSFSGMHVAFLVWFGFLLPANLSSVLWGNDSKKWMFTKVAISSVGRLITLLAAGYILAM